MESSLKVEGNAEQSVREAIVNLIRAAATMLPEDVEDALEDALKREDNPVAVGMLKAILQNTSIARTEGLPICQDTGTVIFYVKAGERFPLLGHLGSMIRMATRDATERIPLRPNAVDVITGKNSGDNTGRYLPWIEWEIVPEVDYADVDIVLKGGGSEAPSIAKTITPAEGLKEAIRLAIDSVVAAGAKPCPPVIVGMGMGPTADIAIKLAKKALLRPVGQRHEEQEVAKLEEIVLGALNDTGLGVHGVGGKTTALDVHVEYAFRHPAAFSVAVVTNCWAARRSSMRIEPDGKVTYTTHRSLGGK